jgi:hypothetical protein
MTYSKFKKGNGQEADLKPWQGKEGGMVTQVAKRCWDGLHGCEEYKTFTEFKWHEHICVDCVTAMCNRYNFEHKFADYLTALLWQENSLIKSSKALGAGVDNLFALEKTTEQRLRGLWEKIKIAAANREAISAANMNYRKWYYNELGISVETGATAKGFASVAAEMI